MRLVAFLLLSTILLLAIRLAVPRHRLSLACSYEAGAGVWVGALVAIACYERRERREVAVLSIACLFLSAVFETFMFINR